MANRTSSSNSMIFDCVVVGAGIEGSCTARYAASLGKKTLCLEQFPIPHSRGSSHGQSRITRHSHEQDYYADLMPEAFAMWADIERLAKEKLFINCGCLTVDCPPFPSIKIISKHLKSNCIAEEPVSCQQLSEKYKFNFPSSYAGLLEKTGGMLLASKCLQAVQEQFVKFGGVLRDHEKVVDIIPGEIVQVRTNKQTYKTRTIILTPGAWATSLLAPLGVDLHLKPLRTNACYWKVKQNGFNASDNFPCWIDHTKVAKRTFKGTLYALPCYEYPNMIKICLHNGPDLDSPDARDNANDEWIVKNISEYIKRHVIGVESEPSIVEQCIYTISPDWTCTLDKHPKFENIVMGVGFSGSGFKLAPVIGKILVQLAFGLQPQYNLDPFKVDRFSTKKASL